MKTAIITGGRTLNVISVFCFTICDMGIILLTLYSELLICYVWSRVEANDCNLHSYLDLLG